jgi:hypothetical protein
MKSRTAANSAYAPRMYSTTCVRKKPPIERQADERRESRDEHHQRLEDGRLRHPWCVEIGMEEPVLAGPEPRCVDRVVGRVDLEEVDVPVGCGEPSAQHGEVVERKERKREHGRQQSSHDQHRFRGR